MSTVNFPSRKFEAIYSFQQSVTRITSDITKLLTFVIFLKKDFIYLFMRDTQREVETQAEGEAGSMQGAQCGTRSRVSRVTPWAEGGTKPLSHLGYPRAQLLNG